MRGFTLIEVLIALAIVSIALAAVMRSVAVATRLAMPSWVTPTPFGRPVDPLV